MRAYSTTCAFACVLAHVPSVEADVEIGAATGVHVFSSTNELGVPDVPSATSERNAALVGIRLGVMLDARFGIEGEFAVIPSESRTGSVDVVNVAYRAHLVAQLRGANPEAKLVPFGLIGGGALMVASSDMHDVIAEDTDAALYFGGGAKYRLAPGWGLRADLRVLFPPGSTSEGPTVDVEVLASVYKTFGGKVARPAESPKPKPPGDTDGDGLLDPADQCPRDPEDKDGYQDDDGCPDADDDGDGVPDATDNCMMEPEDKDGFADDDGCPELDNDADAIPDAADKCPNEAEDKDSFQDDDGCPDHDNDGDGIPDVTDKCPIEPETKNGFRDDDGCPDEIPQQVKRFTGVIQGINFKVNSADLLPGSNRTLDRAVAVLKEFPDLKLEIQGHTDDQPVKRGRFADNQTLSQARADSVRSYLVVMGIDSNRVTAVGFGDSVPIIAPQGLKGRHLRSARAKNRRVEFRLVAAP